jgi:uncharacterized protein YndB with AHSA1/START domain
LSIAGSTINKQPKGYKDMATTAHKITIDAPQEQVYQALATIDGLKGWYTPNVEGRVGKNEEATFTFKDKEPFKWRFTDLKPNSLVRWTCVEGPGAAAGTTVTFKVSEKSKHQTVVECDHEDWPDGHGALKTCNTLWGILMGHLKEYSETRVPSPAFN